MSKSKKNIFIFSVIIITLCVYAMNNINHNPIIQVSASSNSEIDDNVIEYSIGSKQNIEYEMDINNNINNIYMLYKITTTSTGLYTIDINNVPKDNDTYINVSILDLELNEYGTFSTIQWDENTNNNIYFDEYSYDIDLLGEKTYYIFICCNSHEYKEVYCGNIDFSLNLNRTYTTEIIEEGNTIINASYNKTVYRTICVDSDGWYKIKTDLTDNNVLLELYNGEQIVSGNDNTYFLYKEVDYYLYINAYNECIEDDSDISFGITVDKINILSLEDDNTITYSNNAICTYTAQNNEEIAIFSDSENADPSIIVLNNDIEIIRGDDMASDNSKDYKIALEVKENETYTLLLSDNLASSENIDVTIQTCDIGLNGTINLHSPEPTKEPIAEPTNEPTATAEPTYTPEQEGTATPTSEPVITPTEQPVTKPSAQSTQAPTFVTTPTIAPAPVQTVAPTDTPKADVEASKSDKVKTFKLSSLKIKKKTTKITGKVSVSKATVKIKVGSKAWKKATVKGKKFTLKTAKLKKNTKVKIKVSKKGYKTLKKSYKVK